VGIFVRRLLSTLKLSDLDKYVPVLRAITAVKSDATFRILDTPVVFRFLTDPTEKFVITPGGFEESNIGGAFVVKFEATPKSRLLRIHSPVLSIYLYP
jgi:hypothetical protein